LKTSKKVVARRAATKRVPKSAVKVVRKSPATVTLLTERSTASAEQLGVPVLKFPADWTRYGRAAWLAFYPDLENSKGTTTARSSRCTITWEASDEG